MCNQLASVYEDTEAEQSINEKFSFLAFSVLSWAFSQADNLHLLFLLKHLLISPLYTEVFKESRELLGKKRLRMYLGSKSVKGYQMFISCD